MPIGYVRVHEGLHLAYIDGYKRLYEHYLALLQQGKHYEAKF